jgi:hypothetical protein
MKNETLIHSKGESKLQSDLVELNRKINYWRDKENEAKFRLAENLRKKAELLDDIQSEGEAEQAKLLFAESEKVDPSECNTYDQTFLEATKAEVYKCKATGWHYLFYIDEREYPYYCCITVDDGEFKTLQELQKWARPLYFQ